MSVNGVESSETKSFSVGNSENSIEWTDLNLTGNEIVLTATSITAGIQFAGVSVTYTEGGGGVVTPVELGDIVATCGTTVFEHDGVYENLVEGDVLAFSCENAETITVTNSESATLASNTAGSECSWTATPTEAEELTVTATLGETSKSIIFMIAVAEKGDTPEPTPGNGGWYKVTSNSDIEAGGRYIIAVTGTLKNNTTNQAVSTEVSTNNRKVTSITLNSDKSQIIDPSESVMTFILEKDGADYLWKAENYQNNQEVNYLYGFTGASAANRMMCGNPQTANVDRRNTSISIGDNGNATITFVNCAKDEVNYVVYFNDNTSGSGGNCFNSYCKTNDNYFPVQLYKYVVEETPESPAYPTAQVDDAAYDSDEAISLDGKERVVVTLSHADSENHAIFYKFVGQATPAAQAEDNNDGFTEYSEPIVIKEAGTLQYYAQHKTSGVKSETRSISFTGVTTSVSEIEVAGVEAEYYDLSGRRIEAPVKGIVIKKTGSKVSKYVF